MTTRAVDYLHAVAWDLWASFKRWFFKRPLIKPPRSGKERLQNASRALFGDDRLLKWEADVHDPARPRDL